MRALYKFIIITNLILSGVLLALVFNLPEISMRFLLVGELPDGITLLSPEAMFAILSCGFIVTLILVSPALFVNSVQKIIRSSSKLSLPKRRYTSL